MKQVKSLFFFSLLSIITQIAANGCDPAPTIIPRSQSRAKDRQVVGTVGRIHVPDETYYVSVMPVYERSFRPDHLAECLFGPSVTNNNGCTSILVQGSNVTNRNANAWLADYFYLPTQFSSTLTFKPRIQNFLVDFDLFIPLDQCIDGFYFRAYGPVTYTRWNLNFCECLDPSATGTIAHPAGYFTPSEIAPSQLLENFSSYAAGRTIGPVDGVHFQQLKFARFDCKSKSKTGFADLRMELGWDYFKCDGRHIGFNIQMAAPTGTKVDACHAFEPLVGNGHHWELGGGLTAHYDVWYNCDETSMVSLHMDLNATHMFSTHQRRTFDLCGKPNSRYMLAERLGTPVNFNLEGGTEASSIDALYQFKNEFAPVANLTTMDVKVSVAVQADLVFWANWAWCNWSWDLGYNFWARSCEKIECFSRDPNPLCNPLSICNPSQANTWALKGDARVFGFASGTFGSLIIDQAVALSATESNATICAGTNAGSLLNAGIDNPRLATAGTANVALIFEPGGVGQINTSIQPQFLSCDDILLERTRGITHKIFTLLSYNFWDWDCWQPYVGIGGFAEFAQHKNKDNCCTTTVPNTNFVANSCSTLNCNTQCNPCSTPCDPCADHCKNCAVSQWGVWLKAGTSF